MGRGTLKTSAPPAPRRPAQGAGLRLRQAARDMLPAARRWMTGSLPLAILSALLLAALIMMSAATQNSVLFGRMYSWLLVISLIGIALLILLIVLNVLQLVEQYRARVPGSRLTLRLLVIFGILALAPVSAVFFFSVQTLHRGIDNWFDVRIDKALDDALLLGRTAVDAVKQDALRNTQAIATELEILSFSTRPGASARALLPALDALREQYGSGELTLFAGDGRILAAATDTGPEAGSLVPERPRDAVLAQVRSGQPYANLEVIGRGGLRIRVVVPVYSREVGAPLRILQVLQPLPPRYTKLGESIQSAYAEYEKLDYLRGPLKFGFTLTLSLVALLTLLIAVWTAMFTARRLVAPIRDLAEGTRAIAAGNYRKRLPITTHDEIGVLVASFNDMTRRIQHAQTDSRRAQQEAERSRAHLETVLAHLSSGVMSFDARAVLRTHNAAAAQILGADLRAVEGRALGELAVAAPALAPLTETLGEALKSGGAEWQREVALENHNNARRVLILRGTRLPRLAGKRGGYVVVFDDVSALIQAQRQAAWGEVARRMAHEIKNPLTPIQLSAERIRHKYLRLLPEAERETLERATHTIVDQVEALKHMVNAFSDYARPAQLHAQAVSLNDLVRDVVELYIAGQEKPRDFARTDVLPLRASENAQGAARNRNVVLRLSLARNLPPLSADGGRLRQVLHNLLINARDALVETPRPVIRLSTRAVEEGQRRFVELTVQDNGPGFPPALLERLFEPYVTTKEKGTGLGLAIVRRIVEEHGGAIHAENLTDGGAAVTLRLPLVESAVAAPAEHRRKRRRETDR